MGELAPWEVRDARGNMAVLLLVPRCSRRPPAGKLHVARMCEVGANVGEAAVVRSPSIHLSVTCNPRVRRYDLLGAIGPC